MSLACQFTSVDQQEGAADSKYVDVLELDDEEEALTDFSRLVCASPGSEDHRKILPVAIGREAEPATLQLPWKAIWGVCNLAHKCDVRYVPARSVSEI